MPKRKPIKVIHRKLGREKAHGQAWQDHRIIEIDERLTGIDYLDTVIHEVLHVQQPELSERVVARNATEMAKILWDLGIRWVDT